MNILAYLLLFASVACLFAAVGIAVYTLAMVPPVPVENLGVRGLKRRLSLEHNALWRKTEPGVRWLADRVEPLVKADLHKRVDALISLSGNMLGLRPAEYVALSMITAVLGGVIGTLAHFAFKQPPIVVIFAIAIGALGPYWSFAGEGQKRLRKIELSLPYAVDLIALALGAGLDFPGSLRQFLAKTSAPDSPLAEEIALILQGLQIGKTRKHALLEFLDRAPTDAVREFVTASVQAEERGNPLVDVLRVQATSFRQRRSVRAEETAAKAGMKMLGPCVCMFMCVLILIAGPMFLSVAPMLQR